MALARARPRRGERLATAATRRARVRRRLARALLRPGAADLRRRRRQRRAAARARARNALALTRLAELRSRSATSPASFDQREPRSRPGTGTRPSAHRARLCLSEPARRPDRPRRVRDARSRSSKPRRCRSSARGLALIQRGDLDAGRRQVEVAVALDPSNALARSYMAKVYEAENRAKLPGSQLELAKRFDPPDPTPWLYDALQKLSANRPVEALQDLQAATTKNDNRAAFRSQLALDADLATRSGGIARVDTRARLRAARVGRRLGCRRPIDRATMPATACSRTSTRASRATRSRASASCSSRSCCSREPDADPAAARATELVRHGPARPEPGRVQRVRLAAHAQRSASAGVRAVAGGDDVAGTDVTLAGLHDQVSYSVGGYRFATDGFRANNDLDQRIANAFVQFRPALDTSLQAELRSTRATTAISR